MKNPNFKAMRATRRHLLLLIFITFCVLLLRLLQIKNAQHGTGLPSFEFQVSDTEINSRQLLDLNDFRYVIKPPTCQLEDRRPLLGKIA